MKASVMGVDGSRKGEVELPRQFAEEYRPDLIRRAFHAQRTLLLQPKGNYILAGFNTTAEYYGRRHAWRQTINTGRSRLPREKLPKGRSGRVLRVPHATKGHRAHPPKPWTKIIEKINLKEKNYAVRSAIAATANSDIVAGRGHVFSGVLPLVADDSIESLNKVKDVKAALEKMGAGDDLRRASDGRKHRSGRARLRRGGYRVPKSVLIVIGEDKGVWKAGRNIPGVDVVKVGELNADLLAPGGDAGRLTLWTQSALLALGEKRLFE
ncbi:TPA: 50S ribosomal protein L4 [Candidatus Micrarchaeota archaeon]|nr:MAG: 50S ribosomal protein L4 [Candidatus Micrarchaeota archaeon CG1_02_51_15]HII38892.1 50S ribosomal protein L4 [Candidatus Micrarchaeota archaeon]